MTNLQTAGATATVSADRIAEAFFGYFPTWQMFSKDIAAKRDLSNPDKRREENWVLTAIEFLADLVGQPHDDLIGLYYQVQSGKVAPAADQLLGYYDDAFRTYYGKPSGAFPSL